MSLVPHHLVRLNEAEILQPGASMIRLLADHDTTGGAISANRTTLPNGGTGAPPHLHRGSTEVFFVLDGALDALAGDETVELAAGDFLVVPKGMPHAFAAPPGRSADVLITFAPAMIKRFDYFRLVDRVLKGEADPQEILDSGDTFDNHWVDSAAWPPHHHAVQP